jgi:hypothetical protein
MGVLRIVIPCVLAGAALGGCDRAPQPSAAPAVPVSAASAGPSDEHLPSPAQLDAYVAEGPDPTVRRISSIDFWLNYQLMRATGIERELGGEEPAVAALEALGAAYERRLRVAEIEMPKLIPVFTGEGLESGFTGMGIGSFLGTMTSGMLAGAVSSLSDAELAALSKAPLKSGNAADGGTGELQFAADGSLTQALEFVVQEKGLNGKVRTKVRMDSCPDVDGRVSIDIEVDSQMSVSGKPGTGGYFHTEFRYERYLNDDAHLSAEPNSSTSRLRVRMGGYENFDSQRTDVTMGYGRDGKSFMTEQDSRGFGIFRPEDQGRAIKLLTDAQLMQTLMAEAMLRGLGSKAGAPWEGGHCIKLEVTSSPAARTHLEPAAAFQIEARPRVKSDGSPAQGTVTATLSGGSSLQPASGKVPADARFQYVGPGEKDETAAIAFESRSKRGVGKATLEFDTRVAGGFMMEGGAPELHFKGQVCDLEERFFLRSDGALNDVAIRFDPRAGKYSYSGTMSGYDDKGRKYTFPVQGKGTFEFKYGGDLATGLTASGEGTVQTPYGPLKGHGTEKYTLTPLPEGATCTAATD